MFDLFRKDMFGIEIKTDESMTETVWEFPVDKYVEYGPEDMWWAVKCGFGRWVTRPLNSVYEMNMGFRKVFICHPAMLAKIKAAMPPSIACYG